MELTVKFAGSSTTALQIQDDLQNLQAEDGVSAVTVEQADADFDSITGGEVGLIIGLVYVVPIAAAHVVDLIYKIRQRFRPMSVLDLTDDEPTLTVIENAKGHSGELVIKTKDGEEATFIDGPEVPRADLFDFVKNYLPD